MTREKVEFFGIEIDNIYFREAIDLIGSYLEGSKLRTIYTPNPEIVMRAKEDPYLVDILNRGDLVTADGIGLIYGAKLNKLPLKERVTGYDMSMEMLELGNKNSLKLYLLGGEEGVAREAKENLARDYPNLEVVGYHNGFFKGHHSQDPDHPEELAIVEEINKLEPDLIFVGMGFPRQEIFIDSNKDRLGAKVIIGNGGVMDILAGRMERAPELYQKLGLEWFYRLVKDPSRLKRQLILPKFMLEVIFKKDAVK